MKKILVVCGNGIASSSIMVSVLQDFLKSEKLEVKVDKSSLMDCNAQKYNSYDIVVSSTKIKDENVTTPIIVGSGLLTGIGEEEILTQVKTIIKKQADAK